MTDTTGTYWFFRQTAQGGIEILWSLRGGRVGIDRVGVGNRGKGCGPCRSRPEIMAVADCIAAFLAGDDVAFPRDLLRMERCPEFQRVTLQAVLTIPRGAVASYGYIAAVIGRPAAARAVGRALAANPFPIIIPCHRVVRSDGMPGDYAGGAGMKRFLLAMEGVRFDRRGRIVSRWLSGGRSSRGQEGCRDAAGSPAGV